jgi:hypothetical protein
MWVLKGKLEIRKKYDAVCRDTNYLQVRTKEGVANMLLPLLAKVDSSVHYSVQKRSLFFLPGQLIVARLTI